MSDKKEWKVCAIEECTEEYRSPRINSPYCPRCRGRIGWWKKQPAARLLRRKSDLTRYGARMDVLIEARNNYVVPIRRRRAA